MLNGVDASAFRKFHSLSSKVQKLSPTIDLLPLDNPDTISNLLTKLPVRNMGKR